MNATATNGNSAKSSRLVGWLVSYGTDNRGQSFEIRSGRTFISSAQFPQDKLIMLANETVCAPHCALLASSRHKITLQDIFSKNGSFLTKAGSQEEVAVKGPIELGHGDWVRVGKDLRFQLCLIENAGRE